MSVIKRHCVVLICLLLAIEAVVARNLPPDLVLAMDTLALHRHVAALANDSMMGRDTPSAGLEMAATYIAQSFEQCGLTPANGTWFHYYTIQRRSLSATPTLVIGNETTDSLVAGSDAIPFEFTGSSEFARAPIVFAGYGIVAPEIEYDDFLDLDVKGKVVVVVRGQPSTSDTSHYFSKNRFSKYAILKSKALAAQERGAVAIMVINRPRGNTLSVSGFPWPLLFPKMPKTALPLVRGDSNTVTIPAYHVGDKAANKLFGSLDEYRATVKNLDSCLRVAHVIQPDLWAAGSVSINTDTFSVPNVVGIMAGASAHGEHVIVGAHYDHIGTGVSKTDSDSIYNGADDNASGTAVLIESACRLAASGTKPPRDVVFIAFSGEEKGLLGSNAYVQNPVFPLDSCVAMINMDMVGRGVGNAISVGGERRSPDLVRICEELNAGLDKPLTLKYNAESYFLRSDHAVFARKRIPVLFFFTGEHSDYHQQTDEIDKINFTTMGLIGGLVSQVVWKAAHSPRSTYIPMGFED